eukprot:gnl/Trimastix_PCT/3037.p1 GENE.gnl/Trimastix_PCT/3037~~gnl/Trimastix_PCT/3037.p1  ORF type:complete len:725 (-),score=71.40 gnl/Trimastix_PCT/3037:37-2076(-)
MQSTAVISDSVFYGNNGCGLSVYRDGTLHVDAKTSLAWNTIFLARRFPFFNQTPPILTSRQNHTAPTLPLFARDPLMRLPHFDRVTSLVKIMKMTNPRNPSWEDPNPHEADCNVLCRAKGAIELHRSSDPMRSHYVGRMHSPWVICDTTCLVLNGSLLQPNRSVEEPTQPEVTSYPGILHPTFPYQSNTTCRSCSVPHFEIVSWTPHQEFVSHIIPLNITGSNLFISLECRVYMKDGSYMDISGVKQGANWICLIPKQNRMQVLRVHFSNDGGRRFFPTDPQVIISIHNDYTNFLSGVLAGSLVVILFLTVVCLLRVWARWRKLRKSTALELQSWKNERISHVDFTDLKILERIGQGASGEVFKGMLHGSPVAVKRLFDNAISPTQSNLTEFNREVTVMKTLRHPNVVLFIGATTSRPLILVSEFMARGSLFELLHSNIELSWELRMMMALDAALGMSYLHNMNPPLLHRDLKSQNLLVDDTLVVKVADFGVSRFDEPIAATMTFAGTPLWTAPELYSCDVRRFGLPADVYSYGITLWELVTRQIPFGHLRPIQVISEVVRGTRPEIPLTCPVDVASLMEDCWHADPTMRPSFDEVVDRLKRIVPERTLPRQLLVTEPEDTFQGTGDTDARAHLPMQGSSGGLGASINDDPAMVTQHPKGKKKARRNKAMLEPLLYNTQ